MNSDNTTTNRRQQPVTTTAIKRPTSKSTMTTTSQAALDGSNKSLGANNNNDMGTNNKKVVTAGRLTAQSSALIKKAHVRFDDYLDLNEENMRRSCKRLMNHLYSESSSTPSVAAAAGAIVASAAGAATTTRLLPVEDSKPTGAPIKPSTTNNSNGSSTSSSGAKSKSTSANISINSKTAAVRHKNQQNSATTILATTNGKSYLRSQYERRQQRQLELMSKMQLEPGRQANNNADGANECRQQQQQQRQQQHQQQQQDLVARSHELSKRRFFEKLERRESIRNSNLSTPRPPSKGKKQAPDAKNCSPAKMVERHNHPQIQHQQLPKADKQKSLDNELMLKVYQSIVLKDTNLTEIATCDGFKNDTLGEIDGTRKALADGTEELANEPSGFYTLSPRIPLVDDAKKLEQQLIEISEQQEQQQQDDELLIQLKESHKMSNNSSCSKLVAQTTITGAANSASEIKVPAISTNSILKPLDGFISSGLLIAKQVEEEATNAGRQLLPEHQQPEAASYAAGFAESVEQPPTSSGRHKKGDASTEIAAANKTKTPLDNDLTDNKVEQIDGRHHHIGTGTMNKSIIVGGDGAKRLSSLDSADDVGNDNQQKQALGISLTISSENNHNTSYEMNKAISSFEDFEPTTTSNGSSVGGSGGGKTEKSTLLGKIPKQQPALKMAIEVGRSGGGESNCAKDHEAPEMRILVVGQSGGATKNSTNGELVAPDNGSSTHPLQTQSAAQAHQASVQTTITTRPAIRDVLPEANEINRIVRGNSSKANSGDKVTVAASKQVNEIYGRVLHQQQQALVDHGTPESSGYANSMSGKVKKENNVNHDVSEVELKTLACIGDGIGRHEHHSIESFTTTKHHPNLLQKDSNSPSIEEDGGSSCSSSGFGASVSVTSSSEGSNSLADTLIVASGSDRESGVIRQPNSLAVTLSRDIEPIYDSVRPRTWGRNQQQQISGSMSDANKFPDYKQLVGPDQAYPSRGRPLLIENHNYASISAHCDRDGSAGIVLERDDLVEGYANLSMVKNNQNRAPPNVEYATVRSAIPIDGCNNMVCQNKKRANNLASDSSLSGHSCSTSSANSGGFSALPPARLECSSVNNFNSSADLNIANGADDGSPKKVSIFKRFGTLVSRTFSGQPSAPSSTSITNNLTLKINEFSEDRPPDEHVSSCNAIDSTERKQVLVVEQNHYHRAAHKELQIGEADLVIFPPKHVNQRKLPEQQFITTAVSKHHHQHDDRLSRGKRHSRKMKKTDSSSITSISVSSESSSDSSSSTNVRTQRHREAHPKRSESLFEDLESLVSSPDQVNPNGRLKSPRRSHRRATSSCRHLQEITMEGRIDIDCVAPDKKGEKVFERESRKSIVLTKSSGPRSLLHIFSAISSQKNSGSTPNLATKPTESDSANCDQIISSPEACDQSSQPISGFWGFSSLMMSTSHANTEITATEMSKKASRKLQTKASAKPSGEHHDADSLYTSLQPMANGYHLQLPPCLEQQDQQRSVDKYQSLNLYQNLLRNYAKRRNRERHGHQHNHYAHHHHHHHHHHRSRHSHRSTRCAANCGQNCQYSEESGICKDRAVVWGQLIKISKSDGSQVIELQRSPGKSWGFFVARGAINNIKGIFISRMHDSVTSSSLTGLLSIGDRILAIDECPIEPDYDILRVNQMISKKSKILLKVKPFKG